ncbi:MAG: hypothetical protein GX802_04655 [Clostridiales bacterium]|nr:hypothetical protein [Clostridiales bacterium]
MNNKGKSKFVPIMIIVYSALSIAIMLTLRALVYVGDTTTDIIGAASVSIMAVLGFIMLYYGFVTLFDVFKKEGNEHFPLIRVKESSYLTPIFIIFHSLVTIACSVLLRIKVFNGKEFHEIYGAIISTLEILIGFCVLYIGIMAAANKKKVQQENAKNQQ